MLKSTAIKLLGGDIKDVAEAVGVTPAAISQWPESLPKRLEDRVIAAVARRYWGRELNRRLAAVESA